MKARSLVTIVLTLALSFALTACASEAPPSEDNQDAQPESTLATAGAGDITLSYPQDWNLLTEKDIDLEGEGMQILGQTPTALTSVGPLDENISFTICYLPDFPYSFEDFKMYAESSESSETEIVTVDGHEAIRTELSKDGYTDVTIVPNIDGKITTTFAGSFPSDEPESLAVLDSVKIASDK